MPYYGEPLEDLSRLTIPVIGDPNRSLPTVTVSTGITQAPLTPELIHRLGILRGRPKPRPGDRKARRRALRGY